MIDEAGEVIEKNFKSLKKKKKKIKKKKKKKNLEKNKR